jgi:methionyl aminopeptidase
MIILKTEQEIQRIERACKVVAYVLKKVGDIIMPGVTTAEIEEHIVRLIKEKGAVAAFKGYRGFPASACISVNECVIHGIPSKSRRLKEGDIVGIDVGVYLDGYYGDGAYTFPVGIISEDAERLLRVTEEALYLGIEKAIVGNRVSDISSAIQTHVEGHGFSVVRNFVGHGIGRSLHEDPQVPNFGRSGQGARLKSGMTLAVEPMVNAGGHEVKILNDGWTAVTSDGSLSAHFEHTIAVSKWGPKILTILS